MILWLAYWLIKLNLVWIFMPSYKFDPLPKQALEISEYENDTPNKWASEKSV